MLWMLCMYVGTWTVFCYTWIIAIFDLFSGSQDHVSEVWSTFIVSTGYPLRSAHDNIILKMYAYYCVCNCLS